MDRIKKPWQYLQAQQLVLQFFLYVCLSTIKKLNEYFLYFWICSFLWDFTFRTYCKFVIAALLMDIVYIARSAATIKQMYLWYVLLTLTWWFMRLQTVTSNCLPKILTVFHKRLCYCILLLRCFWTKPLLLFLWH